MSEPTIDHGAIGHSAIEQITIDHIAIGAHRLRDAPELLVGALGGQPTFGGPTGEYRFWTWQYPNGGRLEVLEPEGPPGGFLHRFLERQGPGIHHITFHLHDLDGMIERARAAGHQVMDGRSAPSGYAEAFLHPKTAMGIVVQLTKSHDAEHEPGSGPPDRGGPPDAPPAARPAAAIVGLRMRTADRERALRQWRDLLGGRLDFASPRELIFRWPDAPMRVRVIIDPDSPDRSEAIEIAGPAAPIPADPHPLLGVRFATVEPPA